MPLIRNFDLPQSAKLLQLPAGAGKLFLAFIASKDETGQPWCPDVRAALPVIERTFSAGEAGSPTVALVEVGQKTEWRDPKNLFRTKWAVQNVPALIRYEKGEDGEMKETARLIEGEILNSEKLRALIG